MLKSLFAHLKRSGHPATRQFLRLVRDGSRTAVRRLLTAVYAPNKVIYACVPPDVIRHPIEIDGNTYSVCRLHRGQIYTNRKNNLSVFHRKALVAEFCRQRLRTGAGSLPVDLCVEQNGLLTRDLLILSRRRHIKGTVVSLLSGDAARNNYYDWLFHCLPRIELINQVLTIGEKAKFLVPNDEFEFQKYTLDFFGVTAERRLDASFFRFVRADELIVVQHPSMRPERMPSWIAEFLRKKFLPFNGSYNQRCGRRRIFLSRQDASARRMINESDLYGYLELLGFEKVEASKLSFREQVDLFADAKIVVGVHGAGLANLVFAPQGTVVFEIFPSKSELPFFSRLSQIRGLKYACVHGEPQQQLQNVNQADFILGASRMRALFESAKDVCLS